MVNKKVSSIRDLLGLGRPLFGSLKTAINKALFLRNMHNKTCNGDTLLTIRFSLRNKKSYTCKSPTGTTLLHAAYFSYYNRNKIW
jgi:hypothetical protein